MNFYETIHTHLYFFLKRIFFGGRYILIDYPVYPHPHWDKAHPILEKIIAKDTEKYISILQTFIPYCGRLSESPGWTMPKNFYFGGLDAVVLYGMISAYKPKRYIEIGSGFSTIFAASAKNHNSPDTKIVCIDPNPRANISQYCDEFIKERLEDMDLSFFSGLEKGDILFIDNSHRVFTNSDVTTLFFDVFPYIKEGVFIELHDILLPKDYPKEWNNRFYSEQYLIGAYIMGGCSGMEIIMPDAFLVQNDLIPSDFRKFGVDGVSFWFRKTGKNNLCDNTGI